MPAIAHPDFSLPFSLTCDASGTCISGVVQQLSQGEWHPVSFFSKSLTSAQTRYSTFGRELLAIYESVKKHRHILEAVPFTIYTDHKPIIGALTKGTTRHSPMEERMLLFISEFTSDIRHKQGTLNVVADALSRPEYAFVADSADAQASSEPRLK